MSDTIWWHPQPLGRQKLGFSWYIPKGFTLYCEDVRSNTEVGTDWLLREIKIAQDSLTCNIPTLHRQWKFDSVNQPCRLFNIAMTFVLETSVHRELHRLLEWVDWNGIFPRNLGFAEQEFENTELSLGCTCCKCDRNKSHLIVSRGLWKHPCGPTEDSCILLLTISVNFIV